MESLFTSASNLKGLELVPNGVSVLLLLIGFALLQMICLLVISALIMFVSNRIGNTVHAIDGKKYLYDIVNIKKEARTPPGSS